jgi:hypothetical protein
MATLTPTRPSRAGAPPAVRPVRVRSRRWRAVLEVALAAGLGALMGGAFALASQAADPARGGERVDFRPPSVEIDPLAP